MIEYERGSMMRLSNLPCKYKGKSKEALPLLHNLPVSKATELRFPCSVEKSPFASCAVFLPADETALHRDETHVLSRH